MRTCVRENRRATVEESDHLQEPRGYQPYLPNYCSAKVPEGRLVAFSKKSRINGRWRIGCETSGSKHPATVAGTFQARGWSIIVRAIFSCSLITVEGMMDQYKYASVLVDHGHSDMRIVFPQDGGIYQQVHCQPYSWAVYLRDLKSIRTGLPFSPGQQTNLT
ncbi:transposable element Tcb1 transposase [Trichonephila clavipes]|nr:transposable element Tcb1 transposase [Trichonephila clavipes]